MNKAAIVVGSKDLKIRYHSMMKSSRTRVVWNGVADRVLKNDAEENLADI